jgi:hypothetical protein
MMSSGKLQAAQARPTRRKYPLDYAVRYTESGANICRFHNYDTCLPHKSGQCPCDHSHCHWCGREGHVALRCLDAPWSDRYASANVPLRGPQGAAEP